VFDGDDRVVTPTGPAIEAEAQQAAQGPQREDFPPSSFCVTPLSSCEWAA
jgi:hypothetical protein